VLHLHPAKRATFLEKLTRKLRRRRKIYFSKNFTKSLPVKKDFVTFAPANRKTSTEVKTTIYRVSLKKVRHVPRHIELTAVLREILKQ